MPAGEEDQFKEGPRLKKVDTWLSFPVFIVQNEQLAIYSKLSLTKNSIYCP